MSKIIKMETTIKKKMDFSISPKTRELIFDVITYLFVILFIYTTMSKLLTINKFIYNLNQLPLIGQYRPFLIYAIPGVEVIISIFLIIPVTKKMGLIASLILMILFTSYISIMKLTGQHLPCACSGVIETLSWSQHIIFNITFIIIAIIGLLIYKNK